MNGMAAEGVWNPKSVGRSSGAEDFRLSKCRRRKRSERSVFSLRNSSQFKSEGGGSVAYFTDDELATDPFRHAPRPRKDQATAVVATKDHGAGADWT
jgi:hypothetical protein